MSKNKIAKNKRKTHIIKNKGLRRICAVICLAFGLLVCFPFARSSPRLTASAADEPILGKTVACQLVSPLPFFYFDSDNNSVNYIGSVLLNFSASSTGDLSCTGLFTAGTKNITTANADFVVGSCDSDLIFISANSEFKYYLYRSRVDKTFTYQTLASASYYRIIADHTVATSSAPNTLTYELHFYDTNRHWLTYMYFILSAYDNSLDIRSYQITSDLCRLTPVLSIGSYNLGFDDGKATGYDIGFEDGKNEKLEKITPWMYIVNGVNSFFNIEIIPSVKLSMILSIGFGVIMLGFVIKVFLGG